VATNQATFLDLTAYIIKHTIKHSRGHPEISSRLGNQGGGKGGPEPILFLGTVPFYFLTSQVHLGIIERWTRRPALIGFAVRRGLARRPEHSVLGPGRRRSANPSGERSADDFIMEVTDRLDTINPYRRVFALIAATYW
jgi:hypothetical protein